MKCIIVDDEPLARDVLKGFIEDLPALTLVGEYGSAIDAVQAIEEQAVDLVFLDINMPKLSGIDMLKGMPQVPNTILTTAHPEYALEGYELNVIDYLLKPIAFSRFMKAVNKATLLLGQKNDKNPISLTADKRVYRIDRSDIEYIEGLGDYVKVYTSKEDKALIVQETMKKMLLLLGDDFMRIHKSYILSKKHMYQQDGNELVLPNGARLPIGFSYRKAVSNFMK